MNFFVNITAAAKHMNATIRRDLLATFMYIMFLPDSIVSRFYLWVLFLEQPY
jgi:hypothetical protein